MDAARRAVREGRALLVLIADDASATQLKKIMGLLEHRPVPRRRIADRVTLGAALGAPPLAAVAITRREFAQAMLERLPEVEGADVPSGVVNDVSDGEASGG